MDCRQARWSGKFVDLMKYASSHAGVGVYNLPGENDFAHKARIIVKEL